MPAVRNILNIQGSKAQTAALLDFIADRRAGRGSIDFSRITPMPPWIYRQPTDLSLLVSHSLGDAPECPPSGEKRQGVRGRNHYSL